LVAVERLEFTFDREFIDSVEGEYGP